MNLSAEEISVIVGIASLIAAVITIAISISHIRKPRIIFKLQRANITLTSKGRKEGVSFLVAHVINKKGLFGDAAKDVNVKIVYKVKPNSEDDDRTTASTDLPWIRPTTDTVPIEQHLKTEKDLLKAVKTTFFDWSSHNIPQGRDEIVAVAFGIERSNKLFLASDNRIEMPIAKDARRLNFIPICLEVAGSNVSSQLSKSTMILAGGWNNWTFPEKAVLVHTPSRLRNLLLRLGFKEETKFIDGLKSR